MYISGSEEALYLDFEIEFFFIAIEEIPIQNDEFVKEIFFNFFLLELLLWLELRVDYFHDIEALFVVGSELNKGYIFFEELIFFWSLIIDSI